MRVGWIREHRAGKARGAAAGLIAAGVVTLALSGSGCQVAGLIAVAGDTMERTGSHDVYAEYQGLRDKNFAVLIVVDRATASEHPRMVNRLTNSITDMLMEQKDLIGFAGRVPGPYVLAFQFGNPSWVSWPYQRIAEEFTVERLIVVDIFDYRLQEPGNSYVWKGKIGARVGVIEADGPASDEFIYTKDIVVGFPDKDGYTPNDYSQGQVQATLEKRFADRVTWLFYDHEEKNMMDY